MKRTLVVLIYIYTVCLTPLAATPQAAAPLPADTTADAWYNLGNAAYRQHDVARAVLCYERALRLNPSDADAAYNLSLCRVSLPDRFAAPPEMFFVSWTKALVYGRTSFSWLMLSLLFMGVALTLWLLFSHTSRPALKKTAFFAFSAAALLTLFALIAAAFAAHKFNHERRAVAMKTTQVRLRSTRTATPDRQFHAGTTVTLTGILSPDSLAACTLPDGTEAWIEPHDYEEVAVP